MLTLGYPIVLILVILNALERITGHWNGDDMTSAGHFVVFGWYAVGPALGFIPFIYVFSRWKLFGRFSLYGLVAAYVCYDAFRYR